MMSLYEIHEATSPFAKERRAQVVVWGSIFTAKSLGSYILESWYIVLLRCYIRKAFPLSISGREERLEGGDQKEMEWRGPGGGIRWL